MVHAIMQAGMQGIQTGLNSFNQAAHEIASTINTSSESSGKSLESSLLNIKQAQRSIEVSAAVISIADETIGSLIDELA